MKTKGRRCSLFKIRPYIHMSCPVSEKQPLRTFSGDCRLHGPILKTFSNQRSTSCRAVNIQPHKAPRRSLYSPPRRSLCSSAAPTSRDFEFIFRTELELILSQMAQKPMLRGEVGARALRVRTFARRSTYFLRRHHHINLLGNQSTPTYDCGDAFDTPPSSFFTKQRFR